MGIKYLKNTMHLARIRARFHCPEWADIAFHALGIDPMRPRTAWGFRNRYISPESGQTAAALKMMQFRGYADEISPNHYAMTDKTLALCGFPLAQIDHILRDN